jgi:asparagine synthase (glutamine-hydrolysing)
MCGIWGLLSSISLQNYGALYHAFMKIKNRGPEFSSFQKIQNLIFIGFHRLAIVDPTSQGNQPFHMVRSDGSSIYVICNGEIYNYKELIKKYNLKCLSHSDCEILLYLYDKLGVRRMTEELDGEFAFIIFDIDSTRNAYKVYAGRDSIGVRPIFYGLNETSICISSEAKGLVDLYQQIFVFPPGQIMKYENQKMEFEKFYKYEYEIQILQPDTIYQKIQAIFIESVRKRLMTDRPFGCLLSGGLDSSLVCAVAKKLLPNKRFPVFTISFPGGTDLPYAKIVAKHLDLDHQIIEIDPEEALQYIEETIYAIESYDITTVRASILQFICGKKIKENTNIKVLLCGENSDEVNASYKYFIKAPTQNDARTEAIRLVGDVHKFDGLRTDRTLAYHGLEVRLPFADPQYVDFMFSLEAKYIAPCYEIEKYTLRTAFSKMNILPHEIIMRSKEALSDGCSSLQKSWYQILQEHIDQKVTDEEFMNQKDQFKPNKPYTKESYYYRKIFHQHFGKSESISNLIPYFWMPKWSPETMDPSARTLKTYEKKSI